jgi:hypothetical protein
MFDPNNPHEYENRYAHRAKFADMELKRLIEEAAATTFPLTQRLMLRHILLLGATGAGKTNHAFHIIGQAEADSVLIIDVKKEYRKLEGVLEKEVRVLAVGDEPSLRFNPLAPPPGVKPDPWDRTFADVFTRSYGLSEPSRRILLDSLAYLRENSRGQPTLRELEKTVADFKAGSPKELSSRRSLESRLHIINTGAVGTSLNSDDFLDFGALENAITVFEIGQVDSLRDQKFLAELLLAQVWQRDKAAPDVPDEELRRLIVVEEAHRYLSEERPPTQRGDRTLLELAIAEARRYGWGFVIIDQMPSLLSRYVWDNAGTVFAHRMTNMESYSIVKSALGGHPLDSLKQDERDPLPLRLPESIALFRRYVDPRVGGIGVGVTTVPRVLGQKDTQ